MSSCRGECGEWPSGLSAAIRIGRFPARTPLGTRPAY